MQHRVHGLLVHDGVLLLGLFEVKDGWKLLNDALASFCQHLVLSLA